MFKRLLEFFGVSTTKEVVEPVVEVVVLETVVEEKPKTTRGRKPRNTTEESPKKATKTRKPKSE